MNTTNKQKAFTLIELLVVISIIAVLMSILMPALGKVKEQAKAVVCKSNTRTLGLCFSLYSNDNNDRLGRGPSWTVAYENAYWPGELGEYYDDNVDMLDCPEVRKNSVTEFEINGQQGAPHSPWQYPTAGWPESDFLKGGDLISYGRNSYATFPQKEERGMSGFNDNGIDPSECWNNVTASGADNIPVLLDAAWVEVWMSGWTKGNATPAPEQTYPDPHVKPIPYNLNLFALDRHPKNTVSCLFLDSSVRAVGLKELWTLKWCKGWDTKNEYTIAGGAETNGNWDNSWMSSFKNF